ncbi:MAG: allantoate amidohydrolase [Thermomicrobiales bacterium]
MEAERAGLDALERARIVVERCRQLAVEPFSEEPDRLTRRYGTPALRATQDAVAGWMAEAGLETWRDAAGNLIGRYESDHPQAKTFLLGSHLDSVRDAGAFDGPLGVLVAVACVERFYRLGVRLPFAVEIPAFADEEGLRFHSSYLGSRALAGSLDDDTLALADPDGISVREAMREFDGDPDNLASARRDPADLLGYCEVHIEQGPRLEAEDLPVGIVTGITSQSRVALTFTGAAGHAGTVPMDLRRDALCAAAEFVLAAEATARTVPGLVATVGEIHAEPGASNVIPGEVTLSLDVRHVNNEVREAARTRLRQKAGEIAMRREVDHAWTVVQQTDSISCDVRLSGLLAEAIEAAGFPVEWLASGAGHDAVALYDLTPVSMLFVRCARGISHNPTESVDNEDVAVAIEVIDYFLDHLDGNADGRR